MAGLDVQEVNIRFKKELLSGWQVNGLQVCEWRVSRNGKCISFMSVGCIYLLVCVLMLVAQ
jgi:hypothetical protein